MASEKPKFTGPTGDVDYDEKALQEAEDRMHAHGHGNDNPDPEGGHDPKALKDAAEKMATERD